MDNISKRREAIRKIQNEYPNFDINKPSLQGYAQIFSGACSKNQLQILEAMLLVVDHDLMEKIIHKDNDHAFLVAAANGHLNIVNRLIALTNDPKKLDNMIHREQNNALYYAIANGHLKIVNRLMTLNNDPKKLKKLIHAGRNYPFCLATRHGHLDIINKFIELTPELIMRSKMIHAQDDYAFWHAARRNYLEISQYLLSFVPELKHFILDHAGNQEFRQKIEDSDKFINKLIIARVRESEHAVMKIFDYLKYGKTIFNLVLVSKTFIDFLQEQNIFNIVLDYLGGQDVSLKNEKIHVLKALKTNPPPKEYIKSLVKRENIQDQELTFVERIFVQKEINKKMPIVSI